MGFDFEIIVPYRDRETHLKRFVPYYKGLFPKSRIILVEQEDNNPFNRGLLLNVGFRHAVSPYVIFHDIDMLVTSGMKFYKQIPNAVTQLATHVQQFGFRMPFPEYLGGVTAYPYEDFILANGFSNNFWGWGGEDCEMYDNLRKLHINISYRPCYHNSLHHNKAVPDGILPKDHPNYIYWKQGRSGDDGLHAIFSKAYIQPFDTRDFLHLKVQTLREVPA